jgi:polar amino acid transport system substrate-binding protein
MTSERPYRRGRTEEEAIKELAKGAGSQGDPEVVETLIKLLGKRTI